MLSRFYPEKADYFMKKANEGAESRFDAGAHFRTDNEVRLKLGRKVGEEVVKRAKTDGADSTNERVRK